jgi:hypothetical protein
MLCFEQAAGVGIWRERERDRQTDRHPANGSGGDEEENEDVEDVCEGEWGVATTGQNNEHPTRGLNYIQEQQFGTDCTIGIAARHSERGRRDRETVDDRTYT